MKTAKVIPAGSVRLVKITDTAAHDFNQAHCQQPPTYMHLKEADWYTPEVLGLDCRATDAELLEAAQMKIR